VLEPQEAYLPPAAPEVAEAAQKREENEEGSQRFAAGELGLDIYNMRGPMEAAGLRYLD
jgi:4-hydroxy-4-methyl-2-oxoglutarate aldolase